MKASTTRKLWCLGNRRLASGAVVTLAKGAVSRLSRMQAVTTSSGSSEAGYIALSKAVDEVLVLRQEMQNFMELLMRMLHHRRVGPRKLM